MSTITSTDAHTITVMLEQPIGMAQQRDIADKILYPNRVILSADFMNATTLVVMHLDGFRDQATRIVCKEIEGL